MNIYRIIFLTFFLLIIFGQTISAEPLFVEFSKMIQQSQNIVLAEYLGGIDTANVGFIAEYQLLVKKTLKGNFTTGKIKVKRAQGGVEYDLKPHTLCIAFLNDRDGFEWVATPFQEGQNLETSPLYVRGFYDYNAYLVYPSLLTYKQLAQYLQTEKMVYHFEGNLHFFNTEKKAIVPSAITFTIEYTYQSGKSQSQVLYNNLPIKDFPSQATASLSAWSEPTLSVVFEPNMVRPLKFQGEVSEYLPEKDIFKAIFWAEAPQELSERLFIEYLNHEPYAPPYYEILVQTPEGTTYPFFINDEANNGTYLRGYANRTLYYSSFSEEEIIFPMGDNEFFIIRIAPAQISPNQLKYAQGSVSRFIRILKVQTLSGQLILKKDKSETVLNSCTLILKRTHFNKNPNFRKK